jgi:hypothetical protein
MCPILCTILWKYNRRHLVRLRKLQPFPPRIRPSARWLPKRTAVG